MRAELRAAALAVLALAGAARPARAALSEAALERAVQEELGRAKRELKDPSYPGVYYALVNVWDLDDWDRWSSMGAPRAESRAAQRIAAVDLRVGSPALDNHPVAPRSDYLGAPISMSDDEFAVRHALWRTFDSAYKTASADFLRKQERLVAQGKADYDTDDLAAEPAVVHREPPPPSPWDLERMRRLEDALTEPLRRAPWVLSADSHAGVRRLWERTRGTDGTAVDEAEDSARVEIEVAALSPDGLRETVYRDWSAGTPDALPTEAEMRRAGRELIADLKELRVAATTSPFSAPALLDPSAAAALVYALGQRLSGEEQRNPGGAQTFRGRVGERVLAAGLTLVDDPTLATFRGKPLYGHYGFDDQGVPARRVVLVEKGVLKGFLLSRYPVKGFPRSNGHARASIGQFPVGTPGSLFLTGEDPRPTTELLARLREECRLRGKPYGLWVRDLRAVVQQQQGGAQGSIRLMARVDLVPADGGAPTRVRDLDLVGTPLVMAESVIAVGDDAEASDANVSAPASVVAPSLLLSEAELQRSESKPEKSPILPPPQPFLPEAPRSSETARAFPTTGFLQVNRYLLTGRAETLDSFDAPGVADWRQTRTPDGLVLDAVVAGATADAVVRAVRAVDTAAARLVKGGVHKTVLWPRGPASAYRAKRGDEWPDEGPR